MQRQRQREPKVALASPPASYDLESKPLPKQWTSRDL